GVVFFSSRRRHTRFSRDWSSDVCSSDLAGRPIRCVCVPDARKNLARKNLARKILARKTLEELAHFPTSRAMSCAGALLLRMTSRSEERRVGKRCGARRSSSRENKTREET